MFKRIAQVPDFEIEVLVALPGDAEDPPPLYMTVAYRPARELDALTTEGGLPAFARGVVRGWRGHEWNALWKASGDHEPHVAANLESVGGNPADFMSADTYGEHDDRQ